MLTSSNFYIMFNFDIAYNIAIATLKFANKVRAKI